MLTDGNGAEKFEPASASDEGFQLGVNLQDVAGDPRAGHPVQFLKGLHAETLNLKLLVEASEEFDELGDISTLTDTSIVDELIIARKKLHSK